MIRRLLATLLAVWLVSAGQAWACDCPPGDLDEWAREADVVAHMRVDRIEVDEPNSRAFYTLTPITFWKGDVDTSVLVGADFGAVECSVNWRVGEEKLAFLHGDAGTGFTTGLCSGSTAFDDGVRARLEAFLGAGRPARLDPHHPVGEPRFDGVAPNPTSAYLVGGSLVVLLGIVVLQLLFRQRARRGPGDT